MFYRYFHHLAAICPRRSKAGLHRCGCTRAAVVSFRMTAATGNITAGAANRQARRGRFLSPSWCRRVAISGLLWASLGEGAEYYKHVDEALSSQSRLTRQAPARARQRGATGPLVHQAGTLDYHFTLESKAPRDHATMAVEFPRHPARSVQARRRGHRGRRAGQRRHAALRPHRDQVPVEVRDAGENLVYPRRGRLPEGGRGISVRSRRQRVQSARRECKNRSPCRGIATRRLAPCKPTRATTVRSTGCASSPFCSSSSSTPCSGAPGATCPSSASAISACRSSSCSRDS